MLDFEPLADVLERACLRNHALSNGKGGYRLTPEGFLVSNAILRDLFDAQEHSEKIGRSV